MSRGFTSEPVFLLRYVTRSVVVTIPQSVLEQTGLAPQDQVTVRADGEGRVMIERFDGTREADDDDDDGEG